MHPASVVIFLSVELPPRHRPQVGGAVGPPEGCLQGLHHGQFCRVAAGVRLYPTGCAARGWGDARGGQRAQGGGERRGAKALGYLSGALASGDGRLQMPFCFFVMNMNSVRCVDPCSLYFFLVWTFGRHRCCVSTSFSCLCACHDGWSRVPRSLLTSLLSVDPFPPLARRQLLSICREYVTAIRIKAAVAETKDTVSSNFEPR